MGQEISTPVDEATPPNTLKARTVDALAEYIKQRPAKKIVVMSGAGMSTSAGIPDFRSPETGLYANLERLDLPYPEAVFDISYFRGNPRPFYHLAHELFPGNFRPTIAHAFVALLQRKGRLLMEFTQNIDCLSAAAGVDPERLVEAHGSFATHRCIECRVEYPDARMRAAVAAQEVPRCPREGCDGLVKPDIVFFGEALPDRFFAHRTLPAAADLCIILGTSLAVQPFASLPQLCGEETPRLLINAERVGGLGSRADDVLLLGDCDAGVRRLATALGWLGELEALWCSVNPDAKVDGDGEGATEGERPEEDLEAQIARLTGEVDRSLQISKDHTDRLASDLELNPQTKTPEPPQDGGSHENDADKTEPAHAGEQTEPSTSPAGNESGGQLRHVYGHLQTQDEHDQEPISGRQSGTAG